MKMKVADYIIKRIADAGISEIFVVYGAANGDLIDAFTRTRHVNLVCAIHEQGAGFMAEGYAKTSGRFGVAIATSGPGGQNFVTPIANCFYDSVPCLFITGQVKTQFMRKEGSLVRQIGFQETPITDIVKPITKMATCITDPKQVQYELETALWLMRDGRPGPVLLDIPIDVQKAEVEISEGYPFFSSSSSSSEGLLRDQFKFLVDDIRNAKRPYVLVGGGAKGSEKLIYEFIQGFGMPASPTWNAFDIITSDHPNYAGRVGTYGGDGRNFGIQNCDLLICFGTRISGRITGGKPETFAREAKKWIIDIDPKNKEQLILQGIKFDHFSDRGVYFFLSEFRKFYEKEILPTALKADSSQWAGWLEKCRNWVKAYDPVHSSIDYGDYKKLNPYEFMRELSEHCSDSDIIVSDCGGNQVIFAHAFKTKRGQTCITNNGNSPMGFSMCGAIGAWFVNRNNVIIDQESFLRSGDIGKLTGQKRNVICIIGDGGMQMNIQELQTIFNYDVHIKIFIINNGIYGITKAYQKVNFEGRALACEKPHYSCPYFVNVAMVYGINTVNIDDKSDIKKILSDDLYKPYPIVFNVMCPDWHSYFPKISGWNTPIEDQEPYLPRDEFKSNMIINPLPGWENHDYS